MQKYTFGNLELVHDIPNNVVSVIWHGFVKTDDYKQACEKILLLIAPHKTYKYLYDQRKMGIMKPEDVEWTTQQYYPRYFAITGRHQKSAVVVSDSIFGEASVKKLVSNLDQIQTKDSLLNQYFKDTASAQKWLLSE